MSLESGNWIKDLIATNPPGGDPASQGDDHLRLIKNVLKQQFSGFTQGKAITKTEDQINASLLPGAFGLGGTLIPATETQWNAADLATGFYHISSEGGLPGNVACFGINMDSGVAGYANQIVWQVAANRDCFFRVKVNSTWTAYKKLWDTTNLTSPANVYDFSASFINALTLGLGQAIQPGAANLNVAPYAAGAYNAVWCGSSWTNQPSGEAATADAIVEWHGLAYNAAYGYQTFYSISTGKEYRRLITNGTYEAWKELPALVQLNAANGYQITGPIVHQWGTTSSIADDGSLAVTFLLPMSACHVVTANPAFGQTGTVIQTAAITAKSGTGFTLMNVGNGTGSGAFYWHAIGSV